MSILRRAWAKYQQLLITHPWKTQTIGTGIVIMQQSIVTPTPLTSGNSGDMDFQRCHDLKFPNPLEHSSL